MGYIKAGITKLQILFVALKISNQLLLHVKV